ncbi:MAG: hypothetical protein K0Q72_4521, partial [Armatimonadetes bacterium]|nr:hypothetical protein [Armatimonadota bacterium]
MNDHAPFLAVSSFVMEEASSGAVSRDNSGPAHSPFLALYESPDLGMVDPQAEDYVSFLNELYDEEFNDALAELVDEAAGIYETQHLNEHEDPQAVAYQAGRLLNQ